MKISCTQENLNQGLTIASHISNKNSNLPILANILFKIEDKILKLTTTDLEIGITTQVRGKIEKEGEFTIDAKLLNDFISLLPKERLDLEFQDNQLKISSSKQKTTIKTESPDDFPLIPKIKKEQVFVIPISEFKDAVSEVVFAVSNSETRPEISGIFMEFNSNKLTLAATDSYRLAERKINLPESNNLEKKIIIPVKTLQEVSRILGILKEDISLGDLENIEIYLFQNQIMFSCGNTEIISRLIDGQYPDYQQIIPSGFKTKIKLETNKLIKAVKTSSLFSRSGIFDIALNFKIKENQLIVNSSSTQTGENTFILKTEEAQGEDNKIILNHRYLLDSLNNINSEKVIIETNLNNTPCVLKPEAEKELLYIIMPINPEE